MPRSPTRSKDKLKSKELIIIAGDTLPPQMDALKAGRSHVQIGQRPSRWAIGRRRADVDLIKGKTVKDPAVTPASTNARRTTAATCIAK